MNGRSGWLLQVGLLALGLGSLALALALRPLQGWLCLAIWGAGAMVGGILAPDPPGNWSQPPTLPGMLHGGAAMVAFLAFPLAAIRLSGQLACRELRWIAWVTAATLVLFLLCLAPAIVVNRAPILLGLVERVLLLGILVWLGLTARKALTARGSLVNYSKHEGLVSY